MEKQPRWRPERHFENAKRVIVECELDKCPHCGEELKARKGWHMDKTVQTLQGPLLVAGRSKECVNPNCPHSGAHYYAGGVLKISLPKSTYGLDVLAYIGWEHEHEHRQLVEIQRALNGQGILVNERNVGKLYRQFLGLLGGMSEQTQRKLEETVKEKGGLIVGLDGLKPEGCGSMLYVLYDVLSKTPLWAIQLERADADKLSEWMEAYKKYPVLATISDGEDTLIAALKKTWPAAPHQRCQEHFLGNVVESSVLDYDTQLRQGMRNSLGGLPQVPESAKSPLFFAVAGETTRDAVMMEIEGQLRSAIRDSINQVSRKPFHWGGLQGYQQLAAIADALHTVANSSTDNAYLQCLSMQMNRALVQNRALADGLEETHTWLRKVAACLRYPPSSYSEEEVSGVSSQQVAQEMEGLLQKLHQEAKGKRILSDLFVALDKRWKEYGAELLHCYDIPGLPPDNLRLESFFNRMRNHQRRISGRQSTKELRSFGQLQTLFCADSQATLLEQLRQVPLPAYKRAREQLAKLEAPRQFLSRLHHDPYKTICGLLNRYVERQVELVRDAQVANSPPVLCAI